MGDAKEKAVGVEGHERITRLFLTFMRGRVRA